MINDKVIGTRRWTIRRYATAEDYAKGVPTPVIDANGRELPAEAVLEGNLMLNEGIALMADLLIGAGGTAFNNANSYLGVGDGTTAEDATQTDLVGTNKTYKAMVATYPQRSNQTVTWRAEFGGTDANHDWQEFTVANGGSGASANLNRKVSNQGTKVAGQTWTLDLAITFS